MNVLNFSGQTSPPRPLSETERGRKILFGEGARGEVSDV